MFISRPRFKRVNGNNYLHIVAGEKRKKPETRPLAFTWPYATKITIQLRHLQPQFQIHSEAYLKSTQLQEANFKDIIIAHMKDYNLTKDEINYGFPLPLYGIIMSYITQPTFYFGIGGPDNEDNVHYFQDFINNVIHVQWRKYPDDKSSNRHELCYSTIELDLHNFINAGGNAINFLTTANDCIRSEINSTIIGRLPQRVQIGILICPEDTTFNELVIDEVNASLKIKNIKAALDIMYSKRGNLWRDKNGRSCTLDVRAVYWELYDKLCLGGRGFKQVQVSRSGIVTKKEQIDEDKELVDFDQLKLTIRKDQETFKFVCFASVRKLSSTIKINWKNKTVTPFVATYGCACSKKGYPKGRVMQIDLSYVCIFVLFIRCVQNDILLSVYFVLIFVNDSVKIPKTRKK